MTDRTVTCSKCGVIEQIRKVDGAWPDLPPGWAVLTLATLPVLNRILCPGDVNSVSTWLATF